MKTVCITALIVSAFLNSTASAGERVLKMSRKADAGGPATGASLPYGTASHSVKVEYTYNNRNLSHEQNLDKAITKNSFEVLTRDETETMFATLKTEIYEKLRAMENRLNEIGQAGSNAKAKPSEAPTGSPSQTPIKELSGKEKSQMVTQNLNQELDSLKKQIQSKIDQIKRSAHSPSPSPH